MVRRYWPPAQLIAVVLAIGVVAPQVAAQQQRAPWQTETNSPPAPLVVPTPGAPPPSVLVPPNTTVVPRSVPPEAKPAPGASAPGPANG